jgi:hypothetical protein
VLALPRGGAQLRPWGRRPREASRGVVYRGHRMAAGHG